MERKFTEDDIGKKFRIENQGPAGSVHYLALGQELKLNSIHEDGSGVFRGKRRNTGGPITQYVRPAAVEPVWETGEEEVTPPTKYAVIYRSYVHGSDETRIFGTLGKAIDQLDAFESRCRPGEVVEVYALVASSTVEVKREGTL